MRTITTIRRFVFLVATVGISLMQGWAQATPAQTPTTQAPTTQAPAAQGAQAGETQAPAATQEVHLLVGHSIILRTDSRLKRVLIGNPAVLSSATTSPNEVVVTALGPGASSVLLWQEDGQSRMIEAFADLDVTSLRGAVRQSMPSETVDVQGDEDKVVLTGTVSTTAVADQINKMASQFTKNTVNSLQVAIPGRQKEVLLKVCFAEVDRKRLENYGINILSTGAANTIGTITTQQFGVLGLGDNGPLQGGGGSGNSAKLTLSNLMNIFLFRPDLNLGVAVADLQQKNVLQVLAEPNLLAVSGAPARFLAGGEVPYPVITGGGSAGGLGTVTIQFKPYGVKLEFTGEVQSDGMIRLTVAPEVSSLDYTNAVTVSGFVMPAISTRRAETVVELESGQSFGIAGLLDQRTTAQLSKVPGIADIPILGLLFHSKAMDKLTSELMVFVTPEIVDPQDAQSAAKATPEKPKMPLETGAPANFDESLHNKKGGN